MLKAIVNSVRERRAEAAFAEGFSTIVRRRQASGSPTHHVPRIPWAAISAAVAAASLIVDIWK